MRNFLNPLIDRFQAVYPPNRLAIMLFVVLAPVWAWLSDHGLDVSPGVALSVLLGAAALLYKFLDGWQKDEERARFPSPETTEADWLVGQAVQARSAERVAALNAGTHVSTLDDFLPDLVKDVFVTEDEVPGAESETAVVAPPAADLQADAAVTPPPVPGPEDGPPRPRVPPRRQ